MSDKIRKTTTADLDVGSKSNLVACLLDVRKEFQTDKFGAVEIVVSHDPATEAKPDLMRHLSSLCDKYGDDVLGEALDILLEELEEQRGADPSLYLVSLETGRAVRPIGDGDVVHLPDYVGEDGLKHPSSPIVHPSVTSDLAMRDQARSKIAKMTRAASKSPHAYDHILNPSKILEGAKEKLSAVCDIVPEVEDGKAVHIEFGHESADMSQPINPRFHRANMLSKVLAQRVIDLMDDPRKRWVCSIGELRVEKSSKFRWFVVEVVIGA